MRPHLLEGQVRLAVADLQARDVQPVDADSRGRSTSTTPSLGFRFGAESFVVRVAGGVLTATREEPAGVEAVVTGTAEAVAAAVYGDGPWAPAGLTMEGEAEAFRRFANWFELPPKAERPAA